MQIKNGMLAQDAVTKFQGRVMAISHYWTGCDLVLLVPEELDKDGKKPEGQWFDIERVAVLDDEIMDLPNLATQAAVSHHGADALPPVR